MANVGGQWARELGENGAGACQCLCDTASELSVLGAMGNIPPSCVYKAHIVAVTPATLLKVVVTGISIKEEQKGLAEALLAFSARRTLSLLQTILFATFSSGIRPRMRTSLARATMGR